MLIQNISFNMGHIVECFSACERVCVFDDIRPESGFALVLSAIWDTRSR